MPEEKPSNPKDSMGIKKVPMSCLSSQAMALVAEQMSAQLLADYRLDSDVLVSQHLNAAIAYWMNFWEGTDDKQPWIAKAMARIMIVRDAELSGRLDDDRIGKDGLQVKKLNKRAAAIIEQYPNSKEPYTEQPKDTTGYKLMAALLPQTPFHLLPWRVVLETALGMMEGGRKYGRHNYRAVGVRASVYYDATIRHLGDYIEGTSIDIDSGLSHLTKALSSSQVLLDGMIMGNWIDDRPLRVD